MFFSNDNLDKHIRRRPSVQIICLGVFLQQPMFVTDDVLAVPLSAVGYGDIANLFGEYISMDLDIHISVNEVDNFKQLFRNVLPAVVLIWHAVIDSTTEELERSADRSFARAKRSLSLITGDKFDVIGTIVLHKNNQKYTLSPPRSKRKQRLWFSKEEALNFQKSIVNLATQSETNPRISLALQIYLDAINEKSEEFKIVKLYNVLECLSSSYKTKEIGSRDAVRKMLDITYGQHWTVDYKEGKISFDLIAVAGKFRDVLMHGSRVEKDTFSTKDRGVIEIIAFEPFKIADELHRLVDDTFLKIANSL